MSFHPPPQVPYPKTSANPLYSGGLQNTGGATAGCRDDRRGQTYARGGWHKGRYAIMYSWYMPKDQIVDGGGNAGHRHDWENVVVRTTIFPLHFRMKINSHRSSSITRPTPTRASSAPACLVMARTRAPRARRCGKATASRWSTSPTSHRTTRSSSRLALGVISG